MVELLFERLEFVVSDLYIEEIRFVSDQSRNVGILHAEHNQFAVSRLEFLDLVQLASGLGGT
jgi:hypothetical protein